MEKKVVINLLPAGIQAFSVLKLKYLIRFGLTPFIKYREESGLPWDCRLACNFIDGFRVAFIIKKICNEYLII